MSYVLPQPLVFQEFYKVPTNLVKNLNPFISGPNYRLFRYSQAAEKALTGIGSYDRSNAATYTFPNQPVDSKVDSSYAKLYMDSMWAEYLTIPEGDTNALVCDSAVQRNRLRATPHIGAWTTGAHSGASLGNVDATRGPGYFHGHVNLPDSFHMYPYGGYVNGAWSASGWLSVLSSNQDAAVKYVTSGGMSGVVDIDGASHPMRAGVATEVPNIGMLLDFDSATRTIVTLTYSSISITVGAQIVIKPAVGSSYTFDVGGYVDSHNGKVTHESGTTPTEFAGYIVDAMYRAAASDPTGWGALFHEAYVDIVSATAGTIKVYLSGALDTTTPVALTSMTGFAATSSASDYLMAPRTVRLVNDDGAAWIQLALRSSKLAEVIGWDCDGSTPLTLRLNVVPGATNAVSWDVVSKVVTISMNRTSMPMINAMYALLVADSDVQAVFSISKMTDASLGTELVDHSESTNWSGATMFAGYDANHTANTSPAACMAMFAIVPTCFKNTAAANAYTFKTGNGFDRSAHFRSRDVQVGDRVRWQVTNDSDVTIECSTKVASIDTDLTPAIVGTASPAPTNIGYNDTDPGTGDDQSATIASIAVTPGSDNQRSMDGAYSAVKTLSNMLQEYPGDYAKGLVNDTFTVEITASGAANVAKCAVTNSTGTYTRVNVPITAIVDSSAQAGSVAMAYLGNNLYIQFDVASSDSDAVFQVGDTYTFSVPAYAAYEAIDAANMYASGTFVGEHDTTYIVQVTRGGVFDRTATASEGLSGISCFAIAYTGLPANGDSIELSNANNDTFTFTVDSGATAYTTPTAYYQYVATYITDYQLASNSYQRFRAAVVESDDYVGTLYIYGPAEAMEQGIGLSERYRSATATRTVVFAEPAVVDWDAYGDKDDEYIVTCLTSGNIATARFGAVSVGGDSKGSIAFGGYGNAGNNYQNIGSAGVQLRFTQQDKASKVIAFMSACTTTNTYDVTVVYLGTNNVKITCDNGSTRWKYEEYTSGAWGPATYFTYTSNNTASFVSALVAAINLGYANGRTQSQAAIDTALSAAGQAVDVIAARGSTSLQVLTSDIADYVGSIAVAKMDDTALRAAVTSIAAYAGTGSSTSSVLYSGNPTDSGTTTSASSTECIDAAGGWTPASFVGYILRNTTSGEIGVVTANTATTITALVDGAPMAWGNGDAYSISTAAAGAATASNTSVLTDSRQAWTTSEWVAKTIVNVTKGTAGKITANTATTVTATIDGGAMAWSSGDKYYIANASLTDSAQTYTASELIGMTITVNHSGDDGDASFTGTVTTNTGTTITATLTGTASDKVPFVRGDSFTLSGTATYPLSTVTLASPYAVGTASKISFYDSLGTALVTGKTIQSITVPAATSTVARLTTSMAIVPGMVLSNGATVGVLKTATVVRAGSYTTGSKSVVEVDTAGFFGSTATNVEFARLIVSGPTAELNAITCDTIYVAVPEAFTQYTNAAPWFQAGNYWAVKVLGSRPQVTITNTAGTDQTSTSIVNDGEAIPLGTQGAYIVFEGNGNTAGGFASGGGIAKGEKFFVECLASSPGPYKTLVLSDDIDSSVTAGMDSAGNAEADPNRFAAWMYLVKSGVSIPSKRSLEVDASPTYNWWASTNSSEQDILNVNTGIYVQDPSVVDSAGAMPWLEVFAGDMFVEYRSLLTDYADAVYSVTDIGDVEDTLGTLHPDNPLAYGVYKAMLNMAGNAAVSRACYFMAVPTNDMDGWSEVVNMAERNRDVYAFAPTTQDQSVFDLDEGHINAMSTETAKAWRIGFFAPAMPTMEAVYTKATNPYQEEWTAIVADDSRYPGAQYRKLTFSGVYSPSTVLADVKAGDIVRLNFSTDAWGDTTYTEDTVLSVESNTVLYLRNGLQAPTGTAIKVEVYHVYSTAQIADAIANVASSFANRRIGCVVPPYAGDNGISAPGWAVACAVAGLRCSLPPQQPMTNISINGFDDLVLCYKTFSVTQLNKMAEYGALIVMQDAPGSEVYIRHQLTSAAKDGDLNTSEFSITTNFDSCSYYMASLMAPYIGRYNITPNVVEVVQTQLESGINYLSSFTGLGLLGPQLIKDDGQGRKSEIKTLVQHPTLRDRLYCVLTMAMPYPFNNMELHLQI